MAAITTDFIVKNGLFVCEGATITCNASINGITVGTGTVADNTVFGASALSSNSAGVDNVAVGAAALAASTTGGANVAIGHNALSASTTSNNNIAIGNAAGSVLTGSSNVIVGNFTGNQNGLDITSSNNNVVIADGDGNTRLYANSLGYVGINNTNPTVELDVTGSVNATSVSMTTLSVSGESTLSDAVTVGANMSIAGDLTVTGAVNGILYGDAFVTLNGELSEFVLPSDDAGLTVNRGSSPDVSFFWDESQDYWTTGDDPNSPGSPARLEATIDGGVF